MQVVFRRLNERQYGIGLIRDGDQDVGSDVAVRLAPGGTVGGSFRGSVG
jgi:hypothetical protein